MNDDFETVLNNLLTNLQGKLSGTIPNISRRAQHWTEVKTQPALQIRHIGQDDEWHNAAFNVTELELDLFLYVPADTDPNLPPDTTLNARMKEVRQAFAWDDPNTKQFTIGRTVNWCRIAGRTDKDDGATDGQGKAAMTVKITLP